MAEHKQGDSKVVVVENPRWQRLKRTLSDSWRFLLVAVVVVIGATVAGVWEYKTKHKPKPAPTIQTPLERSQVAYQKGNYNASIQALQEAEKQATSNTEKVKIYDGMAAALITEGKLTEGLHYYDLKHQLDPDSAKVDAKMLASTYMRMGDKAKALEQYKIALEYYQTQNETNSAQNDVPYIQAQIQELEQSR